MLLRLNSLLKILAPKPLRKDMVKSNKTDLVKNCKCYIFYLTEIKEKGKDAVKGMKESTEETAKGPEAWQGNALKIEIIDVYNSNSTVFLLT